MRRERMKLRPRPTLLPPLCGVSPPTASAILLALPLLLSLPALVSCGALHVQPLRIVDWSPREEKLPPEQTPEIWIEFSSVPDKVKAEEAFRLQEGGADLTGFYSWQDRLLRFAPHKALSVGPPYRLSVSTEAEDLYGNSLEEGFGFSFRLGFDDTLPEVASWEPADGAVSDDMYQPVVLRFSESVDRASFYGGFIVTPSVKGGFQWADGDRTVTFSPLFPLQWQERYTVSVSRALTDRQGNPLAEHFVTHFRLGSDTTAPAVVSAADAAESYLLEEHAGSTVNQGWEGDWDILIRFSEPVDRDAVEWSLTIEPDWHFSFEWPDPEASDRVLLTSRGRLAYDTLYTLRVREGVTDLSGNPLDTEVVYRLLADGPGSRPPAVTRVTFMPVPGSVDSNDIVELEDFGLLDLSGYDLEAEGFFDVYVLLAEGAAVDPVSFMQSFSTGRTNSCAAITPVAVLLSSAASLSPAPNPPPDQAAGESVVRVYMNIEDDPARNGVVTLSLTTGFQDSRGNVLPEGWEMLLVK